MNAPFELVCRHPGPRASLQVRAMETPRPGKGQIVVQVQATSVNPIDVKRARGYGRRLLGLIGAGGDAIVLGNDFVGTVLAVGEATEEFKVGEAVFGLVPTGRAGGAHRSVLAVDARLARRLPKGAEPHAAAVLPYTFCTLWRALQAVGLTPSSARDKRVLIHGASGALGQLATQCLAAWGADITAVCSDRHADLCRSLGARHVVDRQSRSLDELPERFQVTLNFGSWDDEAALLRRLGPDARGHATTAHPLMGALDDHGWLGGAWRIATQWRRMRTLARRRNPHARYAWVVFQPDPGALDAVTDMLAHGQIRLGIGPALPFSQAREAFDYVAQGQPRRAVLVPQRERTTP